MGWTACLDGANPVACRALSLHRMRFQHALVSSPLWQIPAWSRRLVLAVLLTSRLLPMRRRWVTRRTTAARRRLASVESTMTSSRNACRTDLASLQDAPIATTLLQTMASRTARSIACLDGASPVACRALSLHRMRFQHALDSNLHRRQNHAWKKFWFELKI